MTSIILVIAIVFSISAREGYYRDIFRDIGTNLGAAFLEPALDSLRYDAEMMFLANDDDTAIQTKIGDLQYHHFLVNCKTGVKNFKIDVKEEPGYDFHLFAAPDTFAFKTNAPYANTTAGNEKSLLIPDTLRSTLYIGVKCATTIDTVEVYGGSDGNIYRYIKYTGKTKTLNGISYTVKASWDQTGISSPDAPRPDLGISYIQFKNCILCTVNGNGQARQVQIFNAQGRLCYYTQMPAYSSTIQWRPATPGIYIIRIQAETGSVLTRRVLIQGI
jgi:hypothetical protein